MASSALFFLRYCYAVLGRCMIIGTSLTSVKVLSTLNIFLHTAVQCRYFLQKLRFLLFSAAVSTGFLPARRYVRPTSCSWWRIDLV